MSEFFPSGIDEATKDYCSIANEHHFNELKSALAEAVGSGAGVACGSETSRRLIFFSSCFSANVGYDNPIMERDFGPILPVIKVKSLDESIKYM